MLLLNFYKIANRWYLDDPAFLEGGGDPSYLDIVAGMNELLEHVTQGDSAAQVVVDKKSFEGADEMVLLESSGGNSGGYYRLRTLKGQVIEHELWVNKLIYHYLNELPTTIYVKFN